MLENYTAMLNKFAQDQALAPIWSDMINSFNTLGNQMFADLVRQGVPEQEAMGQVTQQLQNIPGYRFVNTIVQARQGNLDPNSPAAADAGNTAAQTSMSNNLLGAFTNSGVPGSNPAALSAETMQTVTQQLPRPEPGTGLRAGWRAGLGAGMRRGAAGAPAAPTQSTSEPYPMVDANSLNQLTNQLNSSMSQAAGQGALGNWQNRTRRSSFINQLLGL